MLPTETRREIFTSHTKSPTTVAPSPPWFWREVLRFVCAALHSLSRKVGAERFSEGVSGQSAVLETWILTKLSCVRFGNLAHGRAG